MPTKAAILEAMQFDIMYNSNPINTTGSARATITYQFASSQPADLWESYSGWQGLTSAEKSAVRSALAQIETFLNVDFVEVTGQADPDLNIGSANLAAGIAGEGGELVYYTGSSPNYTITQWDGFAVYDTSINLASGQANLILHELGHALGLDHPFDGVPLDTNYDNNHYTVMSYTSDPKSGAYNNSMQIYDLLALQDIWGSASYHTGNTTYSGRGGYDVRVVWDTGGTDTFNASSIGHSVRLDLRQGHFSKFGTYDDVAIAYGVRIEKAIGGSAGDQLIGNGWANTLSGRGGNDRMWGNNGNDTLYGNNGNDILAGGNGNDRLSGNSGADRLYGNNGADSLAGNGGADRLYGGGWGDHLYGGGGRDVLSGDSGNDILLGGRGKDVLRGGGGTDKVFGGGGADTFVFAKGSDRDVVRDFHNNVDTLKVIGHGTRQDVLSYASRVSGDVIFDFGGGDVLVVENITINALKDDLIVA